MPLFAVSCQQSCTHTKMETRKLKSFLNPDNLELAADLSSVSMHNLLTPTDCWSIELFWDWWAARDDYKGARCDRRHFATPGFCWWNRSLFMRGWNVQTCPVWLLLSTPVFSVCYMEYVTNSWQTVDINLGVGPNRLPQVLPPRRGSMFKHRDHYKPIPLRSNWIGWECCQNSQKDSNNSNDQKSRVLVGILT